MKGIHFTGRPGIEEITIRSLCLKADLIRKRIELNIHATSTKKEINGLKAELGKLEKWVKKNHLHLYMGKNEIIRSSKDLSQWSESDMEDCLFVDESLKTVLWGGGIIDDLVTSKESAGISDANDILLPLIDASHLYSFISMRSYMTLKHAQLVTLSNLSSFQRLKLLPMERLNGEAVATTGLTVDKKLECNKMINLSTTNKPGLIGSEFGNLTRGECLYYCRQTISRLLALTWLMGERLDWDAPWDENQIPVLYFMYPPEWFIDLVSRYYGAVLPIF